MLSSFHRENVNSHSQTLTSGKMLCEPECELDAYLTHIQKKINGWLNNGSKDADIPTPENVPFYVTREFSNVVV